MPKRFQSQPHPPNMFLTREVMMSVPQPPLYGIGIIITTKYNVQTLRYKNIPGTVTIYGKINVESFKYPPSVKANVDTGNVVRRGDVLYDEYTD